MRNLCASLRVLVAITIGITLSACGVKSSPQHPAGSNFPMTYPQVEKLSSMGKDRVNSRFPAEINPGTSVGIYQYPNPPFYEPPKQ